MTAARDCPSCHVSAYLPSRRWISRPSRWHGCSHAITLSPSLLPFFLHSPAPLPCFSSVLPLPPSFPPISIPQVPSSSLLCLPPSSFTPSPFSNSPPSSLLPPSSPSPFPSSPPSLVSPCPPPPLAPSSSPASMTHGPELGFPTSALRSLGKRGPVLIGGSHAASPYTATVEGSGCRVFPSWLLFRVFCFPSKVPAVLGRGADGEAQIQKGNSSLNIRLESGSFLLYSRILVRSRSFSFSLIPVHSSSHSRSFPFSISLILILVPSPSFSFSFFSLILVIPSSHSRSFSFSLHLSHSRSFLFLLLLSHSRSFTFSLILVHSPSLSFSFILLLLLSPSRSFSFSLISFILLLSYSRLFSSFRLSLALIPPPLRSFPKCFWEQSPSALIGSSSTPALLGPRRWLAH
ncbi:hypothetical protein C7M84_024555 [Penaeus vannamei]|uniref:Uncharacterized protein n=1 Tax=Penaeus vannamei TaxID=6689 RepID=A0A3R7PCX5_PENVA|nr:hypothetical protein C7M84_024555 [Penaeus vannamei]